MPNRDNGSNSVAIVAIIVVGLLIAGAGYLYYSSNGEPRVIEKTTVIERDAPKPEAGDKPEDSFSFEYEDESGNRTEIQAEDSDETN